MKKYLLFLFGVLGVCSLAFSQNIILDLAAQEHNEAYQAEIKQYQDSVLFYKEKSTGNYVPAERKLIIENYNRSVNIYREKLAAYTYQNRDNEWSAIALLSAIYDHSEPDFFYIKNNADIIFRQGLNNKYSKALMTVIDARNKIEKGLPADIELVNEKGKVIKLSEVDGKYILINFWASWCQPCRVKNTHLKKLYDRYKNAGLEIVSISLDNNRKAWHNAALQDNITWMNFIAQDAFQSDAAIFYDVTSVPQSFLYDKVNNRLIEDLSLAQLANLLEKQ